MVSWRGESRITHPNAAHVSRSRRLRSHRLLIDRLALLLWVTVILGSGGRLLIHGLTIRLGVALRHWRRRRIRPVWVGRLRGIRRVSSLGKSTTDPTRTDQGTWG